ncbi:MAG TPA: helix-hairpin-helix domain-containing protein [Tepidisphaeraceae bacterium]|jgi:hypothetical protein|nr:helix-hairpin-helix domain-containing protein [Tepidisphaeraceae bacterium]
MTFPFHRIATDIAASPSRPRRAPGRGRRGSILIMVVAVLVLLAIMGTAFISTTRLDRQNAALGDGQPPIDTVAQFAQDAIVGDLFGTGYRAPNDPAYEHFDGPMMDPITGESKDKWLATRLPELLDIDLDADGAITPANDLIGVPAWRFASDVGQSFEDVEKGQVMTFDVAQRYAFIPTAKSVVYGTDTQSKEYPAFRVVRFDPILATWRGVVFDATAAVGARWPFATTAFWNSNAAKYLAGDADGDGIADSLLFRVPGPTANGKTYYGALRIIDNGSAVNVNTAWSNVTDFGTTIAQRRNAFGGTITAPPATLGFFPSHVGLMQMLAGYDSANDTSNEMQALTPYRFGDGNGGDDDNASLVPAGGPNPPETASPRADFVYGTQGEAFFFQSIARTLNPSYNTISTDQYAPLDVKLNTAALAYRFTLIDPTKNADPPNATGYPPTGVTFPFQAAPSEVEKYLGPSVYATALNHVGEDVLNAFTIYPANGVSNWYDWNFNVAGAAVFNEYDQTPLTNDSYASPYELTTPRLIRSIRSLLTASNPVSNYVASANPTAVPHPSMLPYVAPAVWNGAATYTPGNFVTQTIGGVTRVFRRLETATGNPTPTEFTLTGSPLAPTAASTAWSRESWTETPAKTSLNIAGFGELFRSFWQVMSGTTVGTTPFDAYIDERLRVAPTDATLWLPPSTPTSPGTLNDPYVGNKFAALTPFTADTVQDVSTPPAYPSYQHPARMFRSSIRALPLDTTGGFDGTSPRFTSQMQMYLRAAIAAVNAEDLRDSDDSITYRDVPLIMTSSAGNTNVTARVYGHERQPYITEVYVNTDNVRIRPSAAGPNPAGYIAIELYNPHDKAIDISNCRIASVLRANDTSYTTNLVTMTNVVLDLTAAVSNIATPSFGPGVVIPPRGYVVLENYNAVGPAAGNDALARPATTGLPVTGVVPTTVAPTDPDAKNYVYVSGLEGVIGVGSAMLSQEMVILRGPDAATVTSTIDPAETMVQYLPVASTVNDDELVPLDQFDFTGLAGMNGTVTTATAWHYARESVTVGRGWRFVYPGRYNAGTAFDDTTPTARHQGVNVTTPWTPNAAGGNGADLPPTDDPWDSTVGGTPPIAPPITLNDVLLTPLTAAASYPVTFPIPLPGNEATGMQALRDPAVPNRFPFGGFARVGDVLNVPFIGAYRVDVPTPLGGVDPTPNTFYELNSITMDAAMAEDTDTETDPTLTPPVVPAWTDTTAYRAGDRVAQAGQYYVAIFPHTSAVANQPSLTNSAPTAGTFWQRDPGPTAFAENVGRFVPVVMGARNDLSTTDGGTLRYGWATDIFDYFTAIQNPQDDYLPNVLPRNYRYQTATGFTYYPDPPAPVASKEGVGANTVNAPSEVDAPIEGLVNVNTAPLRVLSQLPWTDSQAINRNIAQSIVDYRQSHGYTPFRSLYDLARVPYTGVPLAPVGTTLGEMWAFSRTPPAVSVETTDALPVDGDITADVALGDGAVDTYKERLLTLVKVSNLITTRSDSYTVYGLVQGWENAGTATPVMVRQLRTAFTADRSAVTGLNREPNLVEIPVK